MMISPRLTNREIASHLGKRLQRYRLSAMKPAVSQRKLAEKAGVAEPTVKRLEAGGNATILTLIGVLRELDLLGNLEHLVPERVEPSPLDVLAQTKPVRKRAARQRRSPRSSDGR